MPRRNLDQYFTQQRWATKALLTHQPLAGRILEPCSGLGDVSEELRPYGLVRTNDIDQRLPADSHWDATESSFWETQECDWVVSNPPFSLALPIIVGAFRAARLGVAMLLRLSWMEPCRGRAGLLSAFPPSLIVLPRISFTNDGHHDLVTCAWFIWDFTTTQRYNIIVTKPEVARVCKRLRSETIQSTGLVYTV